MPTADEYRWIEDKGDSKLRLDYPLNEESIVLDLGGFNGDWSDQIFKKYSCNIHIFEPVKQFYNAIKQRFENNPKIHVYNFAASNKNGVADISVNGVASSLFDTNERSEKVVLVDLAHFLDYIGLSTVDLIKINIEGSEYDLLPHLVKTGKIDCFGNIQVQFHDFIPKADKLRKSIRRSLAKTHRLSYDYEFIWENWSKKT
jgi:FkbM family methyltransferase